MRRRSRETPQETEDRRQFRRDLQTLLMLRRYKNIRKSARGAAILDELGGLD